MPVTPFHMGPAVIAKVVGRRYFSLRVFALTQIAIDLESGRNLYMRVYPIHRELHSFVGATLASVVALVIGRYAFNVLNLAVLRVLRAWEMPRWLAAEAVTITWPAAWVAGIFGGLSHVVLDGIIHTDVMPFWPWSTANPFLIDGSFTAMHVGCFLAGVVGLAAYGTLAWRYPRTADADVSVLGNNLRSGAA